MTQSVTAETRTQPCEPWDAAVKVPNTVYQSALNAMGHNIPTMIGVEHREVVKQITRLIPDYMVMGERGMHDMTEMDMPLPDNTAPMMAGQGPFGAVGMGGMFSVLKVRKDQAAGD